MSRRRTFTMTWPKGTREAPADAPSKPKASAPQDKTRRGQPSGEGAQEIERRRSQVRAEAEAVGLDPRVRVLKEDANNLITAAAKRMVEAHGVSVETALLTLMAQTASQIQSRRGDLYKYELMTNLKDTPLGRKVGPAKGTPTGSPGPTSSGAAPKRPGRGRT